MQEYCFCTQCDEYFMQARNAMATIYLLWEILLQGDLDIFNNEM